MESEAFEVYEKVKRDVEGDDFGGSLFFKIKIIWKRKLIS